jgi:2-polyprenyl-3-methyl-5-hydroxy-6-metoxy-1,4-benzoquinol methylase
LDVAHIPGVDIAMSDWGRILVSTRLEKQVTPKFFRAWSALITEGLRQGDGFYSVTGMVAHKAQNEVVRQFLKGDFDTLLTLDSDADVAPTFLEEFRTYEAGFAYSVLQAFYPRRGWPPRAIWMKRDALGQMMEYVITDPDHIEDVDVCGTHACLFRREVFEGMLGDNDPATFEWFYYPRHETASEDSAFSIDAKAAGFRLGATTAVRAGHVTEVTTTWDSYQDYLRVTGQLPLLERYNALTAMVSEFTGESLGMVTAKAARGSENVRDAWRTLQPNNANSERAFYGAADNGYLYDLLSWNCTPFYEQILAPLRGISGQRVLVIGAGLGTEADVMAEHNTVDVYELPGTLKDFSMQRLGKRVNWLHGDTLAQALDYEDAYDLVVAIDTLEHIHPDELPVILALIDDVLHLKGGVLYAHNNFGQQDIYPMHYDHSAYFKAWCELVGMVQTGANLWVRR